MSIITKSLQNGTIYRKLGEICDIKRGDRITKAQVLPIGKGLYPVISGGITPMGYLDNFNRPQNTITIAQYGSAGFVNWQTEKFWANDICYSLFPHETLLNKKFLYYILCNNQDLLYKMVNRDAIPYHLPQINIAKLNIPTPPLEVQNEIVRILDTFTSHTAELQAELQARKEQYEYYRNKLLSFDKKDKGIKWMNFGVTCCLNRGIRVVKKDLYNDGEFPVYQNSLSPLGFFNKSNCPGDTTFIISAGAAGEIGYTSVPIWAADDCLCVTCPDYLLNKYVYYYLCNNKVSLTSKVRKASVPRLSRKSIEQLFIPIPSLSEQQRIVSILDKFETLVNDLTEGIPAEISAVQEQYEYYRNKLLSFPKLEA